MGMQSVVFRSDCIPDKSRIQAVAYLEGCALRLYLWDCSIAGGRGGERFPTGVALAWNGQLLLIIWQVFPSQDI